MEQDRASGAAAGVAGLTGETQATDRKTARAMFALIVLATDLPLPGSIRQWVNDGVYYLSVDLETIAEGQVWAARFGMTATPYETDSHRFLGARGAVTWHGWSLSITASERVTTAGSEAELTALAAVVAEGGL